MSPVSAIVFSAFGGLWVVFAIATFAGPDLVRSPNRHSCGARSVVDLCREDTETVGS